MKQPVFRFELYFMHKAPLYYGCHTNYELLIDFIEQKGCL